ncbi:hypothetical protein [Hippea alviniae]|uniref:hypothetical protein n=1 Tax=Hippea alviniae TaxID=1279027 RepID=UPI0003B6BE43|nr:hypothetical protein [Hippea alviniae]
MKKIVVLLMGFLFLYGCTSVNRSLERLGFTHYQDRYMQDLEKHTRSYTLYRDFSTIAKIAATRFDKKLMSEYIDVMSHLKGKSPSRYSDIYRELENYDVYYVAFYTPDMDLNNLEDKNSFWLVYLSACGNILKPVSIDYIEKSDWRASWLYSIGNDRWYREYIVKFNKNNCKNPILVVSSYLGTISLKF